MPVGYNHNVCYGGRIFHAQTEACPPDKPVVVTHLFLQGMVIATLRSSYEHLLAEGEEPLRKLMQLQHKQILKDLRRGVHDERVAALLEATGPGPEEEFGDQPTPVAPPPAGIMEQLTEVDAPPSYGLEAPATEVEPPSFEPAAAWADPDAQPPEIEPTLPAAALPELKSSSGERPIVAPRARSDVPRSESALFVVLQPEPMQEEVSAAELGEEPLSAIEREIIDRGQHISRELAAVEVLPDGRIPMDHPAFQGFPMLDLDLGGDEGSLELDLEAITRLDLDSVLPSTPLPGGDDLELAEPPPLTPRADATEPTWVPPAPPPRESRTPTPAPAPAVPRRPAPAAPQRPAPAVPQRPGQPGTAAPRGKRPSLPLAPIAVELPDGVDTRKPKR